MTNTQNSFCWFTDTKIYSRLHFLVVAEEKKNRVWGESTTSDRKRKINHLRARKADTDVDIIFSFFVLVLVRDLSRFRLHIFATGVGLLREAHPKMGAVIFRPSLYLCVLSSTNFLYPFSILHPLLMAFPLELLSANHSQRPICNR